MILRISWVRILLLWQIYFLNFLLWKSSFRSMRKSLHDLLSSLSSYEICIQLILWFHLPIAILSGQHFYCFHYLLLIFISIIFILKEIGNKTSLIERRGKTDDESNYLRFLPSAWLHIPDKRFESSLGIPLLSMRFYFLILFYVILLRHRWMSLLLIWRTYRW